MSKPNAVQARAGRDPRFTVSKPVRKGVLHHAVTLTDKSDAYYNGLDFTAITRGRALRAAWSHAQRILEARGIVRLPRLLGGLDES